MKLLQQRAHIGDVLLILNNPFSGRSRVFLLRLMYTKITATMLQGENNPTCCHHPGKHIVYTKQNTLSYIYLDESEKDIAGCNVLQIETCCIIIAPHLIISLFLPITSTSLLPILSLSYIISQDYCLCCTALTREFHISIFVTNQDSTNSNKACGAVFENHTLAVGFTEVYKFITYYTRHYVSRVCVLQDRMCKES